MRAQIVNMQVEEYINCKINKSLEETYLRILQDIRRLN